MKARDGEKFKDALQKFTPFAPAIKQGDYEAILFSVLAEDEQAYTTFLEENEFWPKKQGALSGDQSGGQAMKKYCTVPDEWHYMLFRYGGLGYGPRYRCCHP